MPRSPDGGVEREDSGFFPALIPPAFERSYFLLFLSVSISYTHMLKINCPTIFKMVSYNGLFFLSVLNSLVFINFKI